METQYIPVADRPEVSLPNYRAVYEYYRDLEPDPIIARLGHLAVSLAYWPQAVFADGAEDAIGSDIDKGQRIMLLADHVFAEDTVHLPALLLRERVFRPMIGRTNIYGMSPLLSANSRHATPTRYLFDGLGMIPVFRRKDSKYLTGLSEDEKANLQKGARKALIETVAHKLDLGFHPTMFPEGERSENFSDNETDHRVVKPLLRGFVDMIYASKMPEEVTIVPLGFGYDPRTENRPKTKIERYRQMNWKRTPTVFIGNPIEVTMSGKEALLERTQEALQNAVTAAHSI